MTDFGTPRLARVAGPTNFLLPRLAFPVFHRVGPQLSITMSIGNT